MRHYLIVFFILSCSFLTAEVEEIVMKWNAALCLNNCVPLLARQLSYVKNLADVQLNDRAGVAVMRWKPNYPFSYEPFNLATRTVGVRIEDFRLRVRGTINQNGDNFFLVSMGDNTSFLLLGPATSLPGRYIPKNIASHPLSPIMRERLALAAQRRDVVIIEGPLYQPLTYLLMLIIAQMKVEEEAVINPRYTI